MIGARPTRYCCPCDLPQLGVPPPYETIFAPDANGHCPCPHHDPSADPRRMRAVLQFGFDLCLQTMQGSYYLAIRDCLSRRGHRRGPWGRSNHRHDLRRCLALGGCSQHPKV